MEKRFIEFQPEDYEIRANPDSPSGYTFRGYASVFNSWSRDLGGFIEQVSPKAFTRALTEGQDVIHTINHDPNRVLGRTSSGTTRLSTDKRGLVVETDLPDTTYAKDLIELQKRGDIRHMSFAFSVPKGGDSVDWSQEPAQRTLHDVNLHDVSSVADPAYLDTEAAVSSEMRSMLEYRKNYSKAERDELAKEGKAMPDGSYPIVDKADLQNAISTVGLGNASKSAIVAHIKKRAEALGATDMIPESWRSFESDAETRAGRVLSDSNMAHAMAAHSATQDAIDHIGALIDAAQTDAGSDYTAYGDGDNSDTQANSLSRDLFEKRLAMLVAITKATI